MADPVAPEVDSRKYDERRQALTVSKMHSTAVIKVLVVSVPLWVLGISALTRYLEDPT
jgi:hypothetical protein